MSYTIVIQDWVRVAGASGIITLQPESDILDISMVQDITYYLEVAEVTNTTLKFQTAPVKEDEYFKVGDLWSVNASTGITVNKVRWETATVPPARWHRWRATNNTASAWNITFRATANVNPVGSLLASSGPMFQHPNAGGRVPLVR